MTLIDADKLIEFLDDIPTNTVISKGNIIQFIKDEPTVHKWIPVSERLPEEGEQVLVTDGKYYGLSELCTAYEIDYGDEQLVYWFDDWEEAIAWMSIPNYAGE